MLYIICLFNPYITLILFIYFIICLNTTMQLFSSKLILKLFYFNIFNNYLNIFKPYTTANVRNHSVAVVNKLLPLPMLFINNTLSFRSCFVRNDFSTLISFGLKRTTKTVFLIVVNRWYIIRCHLGVTLRKPYHTSFMA